MSASLPWESDGLDKSRFEAYAKLLLLKNGRQVEEASDFNEMICQQTKVADLDDADSVNVNVLSRFDDDKLKKAFLDRLSELVANEKGAHHVSSSLMIEWPDRVDIFVAKNTGIRDKDPSAQMLETIASSLREISRLDRQGLSRASLPSFPFLIEWRINGSVLKMPLLSILSNVSGRHWCNHISPE